MDAFPRLIAAGPMFFVSAWLLMIFAGIAGADVGIRPFGYLASMVVTIGLWLTLAPAIGAVGRGPGKAGCQPADRNRTGFPNSAGAPVGAARRLSRDKETGKRAARPGTAHGS